jgi:hypothetical protein
MGYEFKKAFDYLDTNYINYIIVGYYCIIFQYEKSL